MTKERDYQELYDRLLEEVSTLHRNNRRRIRVGMRMLLAVTLLIGCAIGGTVAWLTAKTDPVVNTFTYGDIDIELNETKPANREAKIIPGVDIEKNPKVTVKKDSEACWLFVKVEKAGTFVTNKVTYSIDTGWTQGDGTNIPSDVYYRSVTASNADQPFGVLSGDKITVSDELTKAEINNLNDAAKTPKLTFTAYAVQKDGIDTVEAAWEKVKPTAPVNP